MPQYYGLAQHAPPAAVAEAAPVKDRRTVWGDGLVHAANPVDLALLEGQYFQALANNGGPGTGLATAATTAFSATACFLLMRNNASAGGKCIYPNHIRLTLSNAPNGLTSAQFLIAIDPTNRYSSGGASITLPWAANTAYTTAPIALLNVGAVVANGEDANVRRHARGVIKTAAAPALAVGDQILFTFGTQLAGGGMGAMSGAGAAGIVIPTGPCVLGPGGSHSLVLHLWFPALGATPPQFEVEMGWAER